MAVEVAVHSQQIVVDWVAEIDLQKVRLASAFVLEALACLVMGFGCLAVDFVVAAVVDRKNQD